jgi:tetratricopeptide (TPR) repeat protein
MAKKLPADVQEIVSASDAGYHATAAKLLEKFLAGNPSSQRGWLDLGHALAQLARYRAAEEAYKRALALTDDAEQGAIFGELGNLFRSEGKFDEAAGWYEKQIQAAPDDATGLLFLGSLELKRGNASTAVDLLKRGLECEDVCREETHFALGSAYRSLGEFFKAKQHFELSLETDPKYVAAKVALNDVKKVGND